MTLIPEVMGLEPGLHDFILSRDGVSDIVRGRMFPHESPQISETPYLVYRMTRCDRPRDLRGRVLSRKYTYEIACCGNTFEAAKNIAAIVFDGIPTITEADFNGTPVAVFWDATPENDAHVSAQDKLRYQVLLDLIVLVRRL